MAKYFSIRENCIDEMSKIRDIWGNRTLFTQSAANEIRNKLTYMLIDGPEDLITIVESMFDELAKREAYVVADSIMGGTRW